MCRALATASSACGNPAGRSGRPKSAKAPKQHSPPFAGKHGEARWTLSCAEKDGGAEGVRTPDLLNAIQALYQLSYDPIRSDGKCKVLTRIVKIKAAKHFDLSGWHPQFLQVSENLPT